MLELEKFRPLEANENREKSDKIDFNLFYQQLRKAKKFKKIMKN